jgi:hypothetical protein
LKINHVEVLISTGEIDRSPEWKILHTSLLQAVERVVWPPGNDRFVIYREHHGNGVKPIKLDLVRDLYEHDWSRESPWPVQTVDRPPGDIDFALQTPLGLVVLEWETGNVSSSHRAINKMALALLKGGIVAGALVVPSRPLAYYLTDRIGNYPELTPYFDLWRSIPVSQGVLEIIAIEHDDTSLEVMKIPKGTDGRALR